MNFVTGLHGTVAALIICSLLFVDEAGLPLPIAPNEALLLLVGVLVASDAFPLWIIFPVSYAVMAIGMIIGYSWARTIGQTGLQALAERVRAGEVYERVQRRLQTSSPWGIAVCRMIPGLRPYATLVSGAAEVDVRTFLLGALPALLVWEIIFVAAGMLVGLPIAHFMSHFQRIAVRAGLLVALGLIAWFAVRHESDDRRAGLNRLAPRLRASIALLLDTGIVISVISGLFSLSRRAFGTSVDLWLQVLAIAAAMIVLLIAARGLQTPGENLFDTNYWHGISKQEA